MGKTTLAIKVARLCKSGEINDEQANPYDKIAPFEAIVWISAKDKPNEDLSLSDVLDAVAGVLNYTIVRQLQGDEKRAAVDRLLRVHRSLLIVDNFETVSDVKLADFLQSIPPPSKAIITTRERQLRRLWDVPLAGLSETEGFQKIRDYSYSLGLRAVAHADDATLRPLYSITEGNPKAIEMALGYIKYKGMALDEVVHSLAEANETVYDLFQDLFARAWQLLSQEGQRLLMVMPFFADSASRDAIEAAADVHGWYLRAGIAQLIEMSLLETNEELVEARKRYSAHPLVVAFAGAKLRELPEFEVEARELWSVFFIKYVKLYGDDDYGAGLNKEQGEKLRDEIQNIQLTIEWCFQTNPMRAVQLVGGITTFLYHEGRWLERINLCHRTLGVVNTPNDKVDLLPRLGWLYLRQGNYVQAQRTFKTGIEMARQHNLEKRLVQLLRYMGEWYSLHSQHNEAYKCYEESLSLAKKIELEIGVLQAQAFRARTAYMNRDYKQAKKILIELLPEYRESYPRHWVFTLWLLGDVAIAEGRLEEARHYLEKADEQSKISYYEVHGIAFLYRSRGNLEKAAGNPRAAFKFYSKALDLAIRLGMQKELEELKESVREVESLLKEHSQ